MIIDLHLEGKLVVVVGGGSEGLRRVDSLLGQGCEIILFSDRTNGRIDGHVRGGRIRFRRAALKDAGFLSEFRPHVVIAATSDGDLNRRILRKAKSMGCLAYASDDPAGSDFAHPSVVSVGGAIQVAVSTGGRSPAVAAELKELAGAAVREIVEREGLAGQVRLQEDARAEARRRIPDQRRRGAFLRSVMGDETVKRFVRDGNPEGARTRMIEMLGEWDEE